MCVSGCRERVEYLRAHEAEAVKVQAQWKGLKQRRAYQERLQFLNEQEATTLKVRKGGGL